MMKTQPTLERIKEKAVWLVAAVLTVIILNGCAGSGVMLCAVKPVGQNEQGMTFVLAQCEKAEEAEK